MNFFFSVTRANETFALLRLTWEIMWQRCIEIYLSLLQGLKRDINLSHGTIMWQFQTEQCLCIMAIIFKINITSYKWTNMPMFALFPKWRRPCDWTPRCTTYWPTWALQQCHFPPAALINESVTGICISQSEKGEPSMTTKDTRRLLPGFQWWWRCIPQWNAPLMAVHFTPLLLYINPAYAMMWVAPIVLVIKQRRLGQTPCAALFPMWIDVH